MYISNNKYKEILKQLRANAKEYSTCVKAQVGARIITPRTNKTISEAYNVTMPDNCKEVGCHRIKLYGEDSYLHRLPSDCYALHAEIGAIGKAACCSSKTLLYKTMIVTRYPCEACARAIVAAGIKKVIYSGTEYISEQTESIFAKNDVQVIFIPEEQNNE
jgi:dCMP deaminase